MNVGLRCVACIVGLGVWLSGSVAPALLQARQDARGASATTPQLAVTSSVSQQGVSPGDRFSVVLELVPGPRIHVYAPEVTKYRPIAFTVRPQAGLVVSDITYPPSEDYYYAPLKEHVPVYQKPFRVVQELAIDGSAAGRAALKGASRLSIQGTLSYQACDDRLCFPPRNVPLSWTVHIRAARDERKGKE